MAPKTVWVGTSALEFRDASWETEEVRASLDAHGAALVLADRPGWRIKPFVAGGWSYIRLHQGTKTGPFYTRQKLERWADAIADLDVDDAYVYLNNDPLGAAIKDARTMMVQLERRGLHVVRASASESICLKR